MHTPFNFFLFNQKTCKLENNFSNLEALQLFYGEKCKKCKKYASYIVSNMVILVK
jgi:hypothetical protein